MDEDRDPFRRAVLEGLGLTGRALEALLSYNRSPFAASRPADLMLPLSDEPHLEAWEEYCEDAGRRGAIEALADRIVQLRFPVERGISATEAYRAATRRGAPANLDARLPLQAPAEVSLSIHATVAGRVPVLTVGRREDFVSLMQACSCRNEPDPIPESTGACIVVGLNNWDRVARYRARLERERGAAFGESEWAEAFRDLVPKKALYQDRFILISRAPYSAVPAEAVGLDDEAWREKSVAIRLEHESTHYFTLRAFGAMRSNLLDELIADFAGLSVAFGRYDSDLALLFLGLEQYPRYRDGGRFQNYLGDPPLPQGAVEALRTLVVCAARNLESFTSGWDLRQDGIRGRMVAGLTGLVLEELAADGAGARLSNAIGAREPGKSQTGTLTA